MTSHRIFSWQKATASAVAVVLLASVTLSVSLRRHNRVALPYHDSFSSNRAAEWQAFGGVWELTGGTVFDRSDERGSKLIAGSPDWADYRIQTDLEMLGSQGDVGVIVRAGAIEQGIDSYSGYYVGLRSLDSALVIGRADHGWMEGRPIPMPGGVQASTWYRLAVVAVGCHIGATAANIQTGQTAWGAFDEEPCVRTGKIGLRSMSTGGAWRNISVSRASLQDWRVISAHAASVEHPVYPTREADYNRMRESVFTQRSIPARIYQIHAAAQPATDRRTATAPPSLVPIESLRTVTLPAPQQRIRGVITLTNPLYMQDSTGGVPVDLERPILLNLGDEIEVTGTLTNSGYASRLKASSITLLWDRTLVAPLSISSTQAASGAFNASLVAVRGYLRSKYRDSDGTITLKMGDESQSFTAILRRTLSTQAYKSWEPGSWLRIKGICVTGEPFVARGMVFVILARSPEDIEVIAGPPWWSGQRIFRLIVPAILLLVLAIVVYIRIEHWKMRGILSERERLAHEMHDTLAQSFAGVGFHLQGMRNTIRSGTSAGMADFMDKLDVACDLVAQTHREASASIAALHPDADEGRDLLVALEHYATRMLNTDNLPLKSSRDGTPRELSLPVRDALFQVGREAITNVIRHSRANQIALRLSYEAKGVLLEVSDDGVGFLVELCRGFGIKTMHSRCEAIAAELTVKSAPGRGTVVSVRSPYGRRPSFADWIKHAWKRRLVTQDVTAEADSL